MIAAAIDKYVFININKPFQPGFFLKYSQLESVQHSCDLKHPIVREVLGLEHIQSLIDRVEITTLADIPAGTGLGSSGSFTTALIKALYAYTHKLIHPNELAELACHIEIDKLGEPIGKQDQYIAAYGGLTCLHFIRRIGYRRASKSF